MDMNSNQNNKLHDGVSNPISAKNVGRQEHGLPNYGFLGLHMTVVLYRQGHCRKAQAGVRN